MDLESAINSARGGGQPLDAGLQQSMGQSMGADFSGVRVHTDTQSDLFNRSIQAKAFTTGQDVFFRQGAYQPGSRGGQELIAHELTHVVQQAGGRRSPLRRQVEMIETSGKGLVLIQRMELSEINDIWDQKKILTDQLVPLQWTESEKTQLLKPLKWPPSSPELPKTFLNNLVRLVTHLTGKQFCHLVNVRNYKTSSLLAQQKQQLTSLAGEADWSMTNDIDGPPIEAKMKQMGKRIMRHAKGTQPAPEETVAMSSWTQCRRYYNYEGKVIDDTGRQMVEWYFDGTKRFITIWNTSTVWYTDNGTHEPRTSPWYKRDKSGNWRRAQVGYDHLIP